MTFYRDLEVCDYLFGRSRSGRRLFGTEEDWFDYRLEHHPEFLRRIRKARADIAADRGTRLEDLPR